MSDERPIVQTLKLTERTPERFADAMQRISAQAKALGCDAYLLELSLCETGSITYRLTPSAVSP